MKPLNFAIFGTGFWSRYQLAAWRELPGAQCVALYNRTRSKAEALGKEFGIDAIYDDAERLLDECRVDFLDIITDVSTHSRFVALASERGLPAICQKPFAPTMQEAQELAAACRDRGTALYIHENFRWQRPIRQLKGFLDDGLIGAPYRAQIDFRCSFPVFRNQPFLKDLDQFILTDLGTHILDVARFLFGEATTLFCHTSRYHEDIRGEDVATVMLSMANGASVVCNLGYAAPLKTEKFPQTLVHVEGSEGSVDLGLDYELSITDTSGTRTKAYPPPSYAWADSAYDVVHSSIVDCNANLLAALRGEGSAETTSEDNLKTLELVFEAYRSAETGASRTLAAPR